MFLHMIEVVILACSVCGIPHVAGANKGVSPPGWLEATLEAPSSSTNRVPPTPPHLPRSCRKEAGRRQRRAISRSRGSYRARPKTSACAALRSCVAKPRFVDLGTIHHNTEMPKARNIHEVKFGRLEGFDGSC
jgi:hypothetical protein